MMPDLAPQSHLAIAVVVVVAVAAAAAAAAGEFGVEKGDSGAPPPPFFCLPPPLLVVLLEGVSLKEAQHVHRYELHLRGTKRYSRAPLAWPVPSSGRTAAPTPVTPAAAAARWCWSWWR